MRLCQQYLNHNRTIVTDNFFTSSALGKSLFDKKTFLLGTVRQNRVGNPSDFLKEKIPVCKI